MGREFIKIADEYRPIPFWSWNEELKTSETARQIEMMKDVGIGGYIMHARGGLQTEYMSEEWFDNIKTGIQKGKELHMTAWVYDENGWPSGFGNGSVNNLGLSYQQKYLRIEQGENHTDTTICNYGGYHFYYEINPFYIDTLDAKVTRKFLEEIYEPYYKRFGDTFEGIFTDEPQVSRNGIPWSFILEEEYLRAYGEKLLEKLVELFLPVGTYISTRVKFWKIITNLFSVNYVKQIKDWCHAKNLKLTGHLVLEESMVGQITSHGACMPSYEYFDMPAMDWLGREMYSNLAQIQLCSVAHQLGQKHILTETFALCGHNVNFEELKGILEWQMVRGVNMFCTHLEGYSIRGIRKRDYPPALFYQQPWWEDYRVFIDAMARVGMILGEGEVVYDTLLIHPQTLGWVLFDNDKNAGLANLEEQFKTVIKVLDEKHILFHLGDESIMEKYGKVKEDYLIVGKQKYNHVILLGDTVLFNSTKTLLEDYKKNGGRVTLIYKDEEQSIQTWELDKIVARRKGEEYIRQVLDTVHTKNVIDNVNITYTKRDYPDVAVHYFVNSYNREETACIYSGSKYLDIHTGKCHNFYGYHKFEPYGSLIVLEEKEDLARQDLNSDWEIVESTNNAMTLDFCDYYFDGKLEEENGYVLNIQNRACALRRPVEIRLLFHVQADYIPEDICLACETPDIFRIRVNGVTLEQKDIGFYVDKTIRKLELAPYMKTGKNTIELQVDFTQPSDVYRNLDDAMIFESEKNKLSYGMEIEPIYLVGDFAVSTDGNYKEAGRDSVFYSGTFVLKPPARTVSLKDLHRQGYPFFSGIMKLTKKITPATGKEYCIRFEKKGINVLKWQINQGQEHVYLWGDKEIRLKDVFEEGDNTVTLMLTNNLRNLMGPHHLREGESYAVGPHSFFKEACVWNFTPESSWNEAYCFVKMGLELTVI